ncbi:hypothetical protein RIF29_23681 [Crotalaria pallida]|uniref:Uncharacterized protein n=1 Tax=Crotalaria pallida TaxID=3830 RepID=A0AAN9FAF0_CROPI
MINKSRTSKSSLPRAREAVLSYCFPHASLRVALLCCFKDTHLSAATFEVKTEHHIPSYCLVIVMVPLVA